MDGLTRRYKSSRLTGGEWIRRRSERRRAQQRYSWWTGSWSQLRRTCWYEYELYPENAPLVSRIFMRRYLVTQWDKIHIKCPKKKRRGQSGDDSWEINFCLNICHQDVDENLKIHFQLTFFIFLEIFRLKIIYASSPHRPFQCKGIFFLFYNCLVWSKKKINPRKLPT